jgi:hypothetical protein
VNIAVKAVTGLATVGLLAASMWLYERKPGLENRMQTPLIIHGRVGAVVDTPDFSVKVGKVDVASTISKPDFLDKTTVMKSLGLFVIVQLDIRSNKKPFQPGNVRLVTRGGVSYDESGRSKLPGNNDTYQPMLWAPATYIFEIPKDRLSGMRLIVGEESGLLNNLSAETDVDLGIGGDRAAQLAAHPATYVLKTS